MTLVTSMTLLASVTALLLSIGAWCAVVLLWRRCLSSSSEKLSARLTATESAQEELSAQLKSIRMARNMAAHRERKAAEQAKNPSDERPSLKQPPPAGFNHA